MQYVFLIRSSAGGKKYVTRLRLVTYFLPQALERIKYCMGQRPFLYLYWYYLAAFCLLFYIIVMTGWPLSRQCEIPRQFPDGSRHSAYSYHACTSVTASGGGRIASVHDPKPYKRLLVNTRMDANMQVTNFTINSLCNFSVTKIFPLAFPWQLSNSLTFPGFPDKWSPCNEWMNEWMKEGTKK